MISELRVVPSNETYTDRTPGYVPVTQTRRIQSLVKITRRHLNGRVIATTVLDTEEVPPHVLICLGCYGDTGGWKSKFATIIDAENVLRVKQ